MSLSSLDHCSIRTVKLEETRNFYVNMLGMVAVSYTHLTLPTNREV